MIAASPRIGRRTMSKAPRKSLARLAKFLGVLPACTCHPCLVEVLVRALDERYMKGEARR